MNNCDDMEVLFDEYCEKCEHRDLEGYEDPCNDCLMHPTNVGTRKPVNFKERDE